MLGILGGRDRGKGGRGKAGGEEARESLLELSMNGVNLTASLD